ncbi:MAG: hypothetical protein KAX64_05695 [Chromatiaceae bacterium]|nr:hypothetical protein [Chromatiaceae bacterium]
MLFRLTILVWRESLVTEEDFRRLAEGEITEKALEQEALARVTLTQQRIRETELTGQEVYEIYERLAQQEADQPLPATLEGIWRVLTHSVYLQALGCQVSVNLAAGYQEPFLLAGVPGVPEGTALTLDRALFDEGLESLGTRLRFATYGEPAFDALLAMSEEWPPPPCIRRIAVTPAGMDNDYVAFVVGVQGTAGPRLALVTALDQTEALELDVARVLTDAELTPFINQLAKQANQEFQLSGHVAQVEADNLLSGQAQAALTLGVAFGVLTSRKKMGNGEANFWKEIDAWRARIQTQHAEGGSFRVMNIPAELSKVATSAFLPFELRQRISDDAFWIEHAPGLLLDSAADAACRVAEGMKKKKADLTTEAVLGRIQAEIKRVLANK